MNMTIEQITAAYPDVAKLESQAGRELLVAVVGQLSALAAENAGLKSAAEFATAPDMWIEQADGMLDYRYCEWYVDVLNAAMKTPATDAYMAEVRAQGVEQLALHMEFNGYSNEAAGAREYAAQIRQGAAMLNHSGDSTKKVGNMLSDKDLTDDVLDEIIAGAKTSMEQYLALSLKAERASMQQPVSNRDELPDGWVMVPVEPTEDMVIAGFESEPDESFSKPEEWEAYVEMSGCQQAAHRAKLCWSAMVAAAPQQESKCWCHTCRPVNISDMRFVVCPNCGNKRCPHANDHRNACTGSNEPGQEGSAYPAAPQQEA